MVILFSNLAIAKNFRVNIRPEIKKRGSISTGELISVIIELELPARDYSLKKILLGFKKNITNKIIGPLFLANVIDQGYSKYNKSVFIMKATAVVYNDSELRELIFNITNHSFLIKVKLENKIITDLVNSKGVIKVYATKPDNKLNILYTFLALMFFSIIIFFINRKRKELRFSREALFKKNLLINSIKSAKSRFELETLYANRSEVIKLLEDNERFFDDLFISINESQYLQNWNNDLLEDILNKKNIVLQKIING